MLRINSSSLSCSTYSPTWNGSLSIATCPSGYLVSGGGYALVSWSPANSESSNAPDGSSPYGNGWAVIAGAKAANSCFQAFAVCIR